MSFRVLKEAEERAESRMANVMDATVAMIRPRMLRWLNLLAANLDNTKMKSVITSDAFRLMSFLIRRREIGINAQVEVRMIFPDFDPEKHLGVIVKDEYDRIISFTPAKIKTPLTKDLLYAASVWKTAIRHAEFVEGVIKSVELFADGLWELTGTALVKKMTDFSGRVNYAIDRATADDITAEMFPETVEESTESEEDPAK